MRAEDIQLDLGPVSKLVPHSVRVFTFSSQRPAKFSKKTSPAALSISAHSLGWPQENEPDWMKFLYAAAGGVSEETFPAALSILAHTLAKAKEKRLTAQRFSSQRVAKFREKLSRLH